MQFSRQNIRDMEKVLRNKICLSQKDLQLYTEKMAYLLLVYYTNI